MGRELVEWKVCVIGNVCDSILPLLLMQSRALYGIDLMLEWCKGEGQTNCDSVILAVLNTV